MFSKTLIAVSLAASVLISTSAFALEKVDLLIRNSTVLTMDKDRTVFEQGLVAVKGKQIIAVTDGKDVENYQAKTSIDAEGDIVMPGLINTHTHVSMTVFRSLADDVPDRLHRYIFPLENKLVSREMVRMAHN